MAKTDENPQLVPLLDLKSNIDDTEDVYDSNSHRNMNIQDYNKSEETSSSYVNYSYPSTRSLVVERPKPIF